MPESSRRAMLMLIEIAVIAVLSVMAATGNLAG